MTMRMAFLFAAILATTPALAADIELLGIGTLPGTASDRSGLTGNASDGTPKNRLGGMGSAIDSTGRGHEYLLASDRGPKDGAVDFACRIHRMAIRVTPGAAKPVELELLSTTLLSDESGSPFTGALADPQRRLDPEGIRMGKSGTVFMSDEYGPVVAEFDANGRLLRRFSVPERFLIAKAGRTPAEEMPPTTKSGRQPNRGMEGLAITPDGKSLVGIMQSPLIQDGGLGKDNARVGLHCRILRIEIASGKTSEFVYPLDAPSHGVSEILAVSQTEFIVLERDSLGGLDTKCKKLFRIDLAPATDISRVDALPANNLPVGIVPVRKEPFLNLLDPRFGIAGKDCPEKFEGLAFGPNRPDGRRLLLVTADNDFIAEQPFRVYAFAVRMDSR